MQKGCKEVQSPAICDPQRTQGLITRPKKGAKRKIIRLKGPGIFISAMVAKQGGNSDLTFVNLDIDGRNVVAASYAALNNWGLNQHNSFGSFVLKGQHNIDTVAIGYQVPLYFKKSLVLTVQVQEQGVVQIVANVVHGAG